MALMQNPKSSVEVVKDTKQSLGVDEDSLQSMVKDPNPSMAKDSAETLELDAVTIGSPSEFGDGDLGDVKAGLDCRGANAKDQDRDGDVDEVTKRTADMSARPKNCQPEQHQLGLSILKDSHGNDETIAARDQVIKKPNKNCARRQVSARGEELTSTALMKRGNEEIAVTERRHFSYGYEIDQPAPSFAPTFKGCNIGNILNVGGNFTGTYLPPAGKPAYDALNNHEVTTDNAGSLSENYEAVLNCEEKISMDDIMDIAGEIGGNWVQLGRKLGNNTAGIDNIKFRGHFDSLQEMCTLMLEDWQERESKEATVSNLANALINIRCSDNKIVPAILEKLSERHMANK
ncbi:uncharacterized protein LOC135491784 [Lineus longissimus]|uniref:uncharacterized protein LOC135491784 n=1 Tax=Lineus longissimus TaxID=88925 RepID=UPI00315D4FBA